MISRHLQVLERANLLRKSRSAQWRTCHLEAGPLEAADDCSSRTATKLASWDENRNCCGHLSRLLA
jgi:hypothetical protein